MKKTMKKEEGKKKRERDSCSHMRSTRKAYVDG